jgi:hypothetical protein
MSKYLFDCEVLEMDLEVPAEDAKDLVAWFDGRRDPNLPAKAEVSGSELKIEAQGGRILLSQRGDVFVPDEIEVLDDREARFFEQVILSLFLAYRGKLRCRIRWAGMRPGSAGEESSVSVEDGRSDWPHTVMAGAWLVASAVSEADAEVRTKLEEARRLFDEYKRLKGQRELAKG